MQVIFEIFGYILFEFIGGFIGLTIRFIIIKIFKPKLKFDEFSNSESGTNDFYNLIIGIPVLIGLIIGITYLIFLLR